MVGEKRGIENGFQVSPLEEWGWMMAPTVTENNDLGRGTDEVNFACFAFDVPQGPFRLRCPTGSQGEDWEQSHWVQTVVEADDVTLPIE